MNTVPACQFCNGVEPPIKRTCVVADDERLARESLITLLKKYFPDIEVLAQAESVDGAVECITRTKPEIVFLDIELIGGSGFEVMERVKPYNFFVVFMTAHEKYSKKATGYPKSKLLMKPVDITDLKNAVINVRGKNNNHATNHSSFSEPKK